MSGSAPRPILIAGPTASGKSSLAVALARKLGGAVINADSQQVYDGWRILTARPTAEEEATAPHRLYGHVGLETDYSAGHWLRDVTTVLQDCARDALVPIIVGGTGLYFKALTEGLAEIPPVPPEVRAAGEAALARDGSVAFADAFARRDPATAARIDMVNPRRVLRAWEVLEATGRGLADWQDQTPPALLPLEACRPIALEPPRDWLYTRCDARFDQMLDNGALDEVRAVQALGLPPVSPGLRALGAPELTAYLLGTLNLDDARTQAQQETRRYAKRQMTWIRNQMADWPRLDPSDNSARAAFLTAFDQHPAT